MSEPVAFSARQERRIAEFLGLSVAGAEQYLHALRRMAADYYEMEERPLPPRQAVQIVRRVQAHAEGLEQAVQALAQQLRGAKTEWLLNPVRRCRLRAQEIVAALPPRFPRNQPDWRARALVYDLLLIWRWRFGKLPAKGPKAPFTRFVRAMFEMLDGRRPGGKPPRDSRALIDAAVARWRRFHEQPRDLGVKLVPGTPEFDDYMAHQDAEDFFAATASLIFGQL